jgi:hypothetical protein
MLVESTNTRFTVSRLTAGETYRFKVRAKNLCGESDWSSLRVVRVPDIPDQVTDIRVLQPFD